MFSIIQNRLIWLAALVVLSEPAGACGLPTGTLALQTNQFQDEPGWRGQTSGKTTSRARLEVECLMRLGDRSGIDMDLYGDYDTAGDDAWVDPYDLHLYKELDNATLAVGYQQKPMGYLEAEKPNGLYNPKSYREGPFDERPQGRLALGAIYRQPSLRLHVDIMPQKQHEEWAEPEGRFRRGGFVVSDEHYADDTDVSAQIRLDYFASDWEITAMAWRGLSPQAIITPNTQQPGTVTENYELIHQAGISALYLVNNWSLKADAYYRSSSQRNVVSLAPGLAWNFFSVLDTRIDVEMFLEGYYLDSKTDTGKEAPPPTSFDEDVYFGTQINFNGNRNSRLRLGIIHDVAKGSRSTQLEIKQTLLPQLEYEAGLEWFAPNEQDSGQLGFENDSHAYLNFIWYY